MSAPDADFDAEAGALRGLLTVLQPFDDEARLRIIAWLVAIHPAPSELVDNR